jgi:hypothetical protein
MDPSAAPRPRLGCLLQGHRQPSATSASAGAWPARSPASTRLSVRLWVDDLDSFRLLCPQRGPGAVDRQCAAGNRGPPLGKRLFHPGDTGARVVLETFACRIPEAFVDAMAQLQSPPPLWLNLDYLSAEDWVAGCTRCRRRTRALPLDQVFLLSRFPPRHRWPAARKRPARRRRQRFLASADRQLALVARLGLPAAGRHRCGSRCSPTRTPAIGDLLQRSGKRRTDAGLLPGCPAITSAAGDRGLRRSVHSLPATSSATRRAGNPHSALRRAAPPTMSCSGSATSISCAAKTPSCAPSGPRSRWSGRHLPAAGGGAPDQARRFSGTLLRHALPQPTRLCCANSGRHGIPGGSTI